MSTISNTITHGITLSTSGAYASPLTITSDGYVENPGSGDAIFGPNTQAWTVINAGLIAGGSRSGINLRDGGLVSNSGIITASVDIAGAVGTVINTGTIAQTDVSVSVVSLGGGSVGNGQRALISGGVNIGSQPGMVTNYGTILGGLGGIAGYGVFLDNGGAIVNGANGLISAYNGVEVQ